VFFSARARSGISLLHPGDTIFELRDRADFTRLTIPASGSGPFVDIDTPDEFAALAGRN
jgi:hypothetical protein